MKNAKYKLYKNYAYNSIYQLLILVFPLLLTPFVTRVIGADGIGEYSYTRSVVTYFVLFGTAGSNMYAQREIAYHIQDKEKRSIVFWEIFLIRLLLLAISLIFYWGLEVQRGRYPILFLIQTLDIVSAMADISWYFQGVEAFGRITVRNLLVKLGMAVFIFARIRTPQDLWIYVLIYSMGNLAGQLWLWKNIGQEIQFPAIKTLHPLRHTKGILLLFIPQIAIQIYLVIDKTMIELLTNDSSQTGYYELAQTIERTGVTLVTAFGTVAATRIASLKDQPDKKAIQEVIEKSYEMVSFLAIPVAFGICAVASNLIPWFLGEGYESVIPLLYLLSPLIIIIGYSNISGIQYLVPMGRQNSMTLSTILGALVNVFLNARWIPLQGAKGAAAASFVGECTVLLFQTICVRELLNKKILTDLVKAIICAGIMLISVKFTERKLQLSPSLVHTLLLTLEGCAIYFIGQALLHIRKLQKRGVL